MRAMRLAPYIPLIHLILALLYELKGNTTRAEQRFQSYIQLDYMMNDVVSWPIPAVLALFGDWTAVIESMKRMHIDEIAYNYRLTFLIAKVRYELQQYHACLDALEHTIAIMENLGVATNYSRSKLLFFVAMLHMRLGNEEDAKHMIVRSLNLNENNDRAVKTLFILRWGWGQFRDMDDVECLFNQAVSKQPELYEYWYGRARFFVSQARYCKAVSNLNECVRLNEKSYCAYHFRGLLKLYSGADDQALEDISRGLLKWCVFLRN